ncbi:carbonic anhydrase [Mesoterricola silvestris]|uniref:Carbonic anhydrase n=1 Tax=Mesoterricola silvestris TaxID=2927979 RepID=A0AA48H6H6_9BACT|nr:carbonic anhydrase [Mesoterricola silvestris]BDU72738.1 carbonic anhydrase [Mesoterricola silvestris]
MLPSLLAASIYIAMPAQHPPAAETLTPEAVLAELKAGNLRFVEGRRTRSLRSAEDPRVRELLAGGQHPLAVVVTCSDSRLADNLIFDQELGRLFTIREAGNSPDTQGIASAEYAVEHLGCPLVVVMGHTSCGAIKAVAEANGVPLPGNLWTFQASMAGLLESTPRGSEDVKTHQKRLAAVNAQRQARAMVARSEILREKVAEGGVKVVAAMYDLASGTVTWLPDAPEAKAAKGHKSH